MINNRQNGRRRGRGGQRPQGNPGRPDQGNRIDNRARGNAQQLHEKYKNLARDAQMAGDRVTTEYYLQFADHYFRVLNESRARFEDQRRQRDDQQGDDEEYEADEFDSQVEPRHQQQRDERRDERRERPQHQPRRDERQPVEARGDDQGEAAQAGEQDEEPRRGRRQRRRRDEDGTAETPSIEADRLPPAIAVEPEGDAPAEAAPRRRTRRPRAVDTANDQLEVPPAA